jgi:hypothetical protein
MKLDYLNCKRCGREVRRKRLAQVYCGPECSDAANKARKRKRLISANKSGDGMRPATPLPRSGDAPINNTKEINALDGAFFRGMGLYRWPEPSHHHEGPTPGALQGDDYPMEYYEDGYPKLPACLDRRKPKLSREAA